MNYLTDFRRDLKPIIEGGDINAAFDFAAEMILGDNFQIIPKFREIIPPFHRQGHCIPSATIRCMILNL